MPAGRSIQTWPVEHGLFGNAQDERAQMVWQFPVTDVYANTGFGVALR